MLQPDRGVALLRNAKTAQLRRPFRPVTRRVVRASVPAEMKIRWSTDPDIAERQMQAVIFCLVAFGYIDNDFDPAERQLVHGLIALLVDDRAAAIADDSVRSDVTARWTKHYADVMDEMDRDIMCHFTESVCEGESTTDFVIAKLKLGCFELLKGFEDADRSALLDAIDELMHADGIIHPNEQSFRQDLAQLLVAPVELDDAEVVAIEEGKIAFGGVASLVPEVDDHPLLRPSEWNYAADPDTFATQAAGDMALLHRVHETLDAQRAVGNGRLRGVHDVATFFGQDPFLDQHVYVFQPNPARKIELLVIGDLHGCYSCLKAALMQSDFLNKVERYRINPQKHVAPYLVLLGDYIDRGRFSYAGTLRAIMQLYVGMPEHVFMLRGNHEYYVEIKGRVLAPVRPSEAMDSIKDLASQDVLAAYMKLFEALPCSLIFDRMLFVHGGIPRDKTVADKWEALHTLNEHALRFEMLWSDPSNSDVIPDELQAENARFPFGKQQFQRFMSRIGCSTMVRGHERVKEGFRAIYDDPNSVLLSLFSAGGKDNADLPEKSNYRAVTPMALTISYEDGVSTFKPFELDYARYNDPKYNAFFAD